MANGSALIQYGTIAIVLCILVFAVIFGFYLFRNSRLGESTGLFPQRVRRLSFIERASLDGGRKLLLIRRDDVEHLVMIGGPIDILVETGIQSPLALSGVARERRYEDIDHYPMMDHTWHQREATPRDSLATPPQPELSGSSRSRHAEEEEPLELTQVFKAKA